jgi:hypothetical protein
MIHYKICILITTPVNPEEYKDTMEDYHLFGMSVQALYTAHASLSFPENYITKPYICLKVWHSLAHCQHSSHPLL